MAIDTQGWIEVSRLDDSELADNLGVFSTGPIGLHPYTPIIRKFCYMFHAIPYEIGLQHGTLFFLSESTWYVLPYYVLIWIALYVLFHVIISLIRKFILDDK